MARVLLDTGVLVGAPVTLANRNTSGVVSTLGRGRLAPLRRTVQVDGMAAQNSMNESRPCEVPAETTTSMAVLTDACSLNQPCGL